MWFLMNYKCLKQKEQKEHTKRLGGEIIDISVNHFDTTPLKDGAPDFKNLSGKKERKYVWYKIESCEKTHSDCNTEFSFQSYGIPYLIYDIIIILFYDNDQPYNDPKYAKRLKRISGLMLSCALQEPDEASKKFEDMISRIDNNVQPRLLKP